MGKDLTMQESSADACDWCILYSTVEDSGDVRLGMVSCTTWLLQYLMLAVWCRKEWVRRISKMSLPTQQASTHSMWVWTRKMGFNGIFVHNSISWGLVSLIACIWNLQGGWYPLNQYVWGQRLILCTQQILHQCLMFASRPRLGQLILNLCTIVPPFPELGLLLASLVIHHHYAGMTLNINKVHQDEVQISPLSGNLNNPHAQIMQCPDTASSTHILIWSLYKPKPLKGLVWQRFGVATCQMYGWSKTGMPLALTVTACLNWVQLGVHLCT